MSDDESELAMIRRKKMAELMAREKEQKAERERKMKVDVERGKLLKRFLEPDAFAYLERLKQSEPDVGSKVEEIVLYLVVNQGIREMFGQTEIVYIERQVKGEEPKIRVERDGEVSDFGQYVRGAMQKREDRGNSH